MDVHGGVWEEGSLPSPPEHMPRALAGSPLDGRGLLGCVGAWQQATLLQNICETQEQGLISKTHDQLPVYEQYEMRGPGPGHKRERPAALAVVLLERRQRGAVPSVWRSCTCVPTHQSEGGGLTPRRKAPPREDREATLRCSA